ncbi:hypothetical protein B0H11DRAFT_2246292 [Mycena galericulata]|nr:hypothetical protein B0H11DRAFT_2246292 [Mycena galericulata]
MQWDDIRFARTYVKHAYPPFPGRHYAWLVADGAIVKPLIWVPVPVKRGVRRALVVADMETDLWIDCGRGSSGPVAEYDAFTLRVLRFPFDEPKDMPYTYSILVTSQRTSGGVVYAENNYINTLVPERTVPWRGNVLIFRHGITAKRPIINMSEGDTSLIKALLRKEDLINNEELGGQVIDDAQLRPRLKHGGPVTSSKPRHNASAADCYYNTIPSLQYLLQYLQTSQPIALFNAKVDYDFRSPHQNWVFDSTAYTTEDGTQPFTCLVFGHVKKAPESIGGHCTFLLDCGSTEIQAACDAFEAQIELLTNLVAEDDKLDLSGNVSLRVVPWTDADRTTQSGGLNITMHTTHAGGMRCVVYTPTDAVDEFQVHQPQRAVDYPFKAGDWVVASVTLHRRESEVQKVRSYEILARHVRVFTAEKFDIRPVTASPALTPAHTAQTTPQSDTRPVRAPAAVTPAYAPPRTPPRTPKAPRSEQLRGPAQPSTSSRPNTRSQTSQSKRPRESDGAAETSPELNTPRKKQRREPSLPTPITSPEGESSTELPVYVRPARALANAVIPSTHFLDMFWATDDVVFYLLRFICLLDLVNISQCSRRLRRIRYFLLRSRIAHYITPFFAPIIETVPVHDIPGVVRASWIVGSVSLAVVSVLSDAPVPDNLNIITSHEYREDWILFLCKMCGFDMARDRRSRGAYFHEGARIMKFVHPDRVHTSITVTTSSAPQIYKLFLSAPNTPQQVALGDHHIITPFPRMTSAQEGVQGWRPYMLNGPYVYVFVDGATFRDVSSLPGAVTLDKSTAWWTQPCGEACAAIWRSTYGNHGIAQWSWAGIDGDTTLIDHNYVEMGMSDIQFRLGVECRNVNCPLSPTYVAPDTAGSDHDSDCGSDGYGSD